MSTPIEEAILKKPPPKTCTFDRRTALKKSFINGGVPMCPWCYKDAEKEREKKERLNNKKKTGTRGVFLPRSIVEHYEEAFVDSELVSVREDIATWEARIKQLTSQIKEDPRNSVNWATVLDRNIAQMTKAIERGSMGYNEAFKAIVEFMKQPVKENLIWAEVYEVAELKRKAVQTEAKRLNDLGWTPEAVMGMMAEICDILKPILPELGMRQFMDAMAGSRIFNNQQFNLIDQVNFTKRTIDEKLLAQEINEKQRVPDEVTDTVEKNGEYVPVEDTGFSE